MTFELTATEAMHFICMLEEYKETNNPMPRDINVIDKLTNQFHVKMQELQDAIDQSTTKKELTVSEVSDIICNTTFEQSISDKANQVAVVKTIDTIKALSSQITNYMMIAATTKDNRGLIVEFSSRHKEGYAINFFNP